ncbi:hypothetical protein V2J09_015010 [Rumex salicifolius]
MNFGVRASGLSKFSMQVKKQVFENQLTAKQQVAHFQKPVNRGATAMSPIKHNADSMQNSSNFPSQPKSKKRSRSDQTSESKKRENSVKHHGEDSVQLRSDNLLKSEISKLAAQGLVDSDSVDKLLQLMQPDKSHRKMDLSFRSMLVGILAATERLDCLNLFVQRRGLPILDEWLKEVHKGKVDSTAKDGDKQVEDFLLVLLNALDKLPVNLNALQMCNIGKSVNHLRSHKSVEIHKKARSLVDTWKQRVEAEMNNNDAKSSSSPEVPVPARSKNEISYDWKKHSSASSEAVTKTSGQLASPKSAAAKLVQGETTGRTSSASSGIDKSSSPPGSINANLKQGQPKMSAVSEPPTTVREEKSSTSSQSHTNSQYSSDLARKSGKEDANSSTAGSRSKNRTSSASRHRKSANGLQVTIPSGAEKESGTSKHSTMLRRSASEKVSHSTITCENATTPVAKNNKMVLKIHNRGCSPGKSSTAGPVNEIPFSKSRASSPALTEKCDQADAVLKKKSTKYQTDKGDLMPDTLPEQCGTGNDTAKLPDVPEDMSTTQKGSEANTSTATADNPCQGKKQSNGEGPYKKLDEIVGEASMATSSACVIGEGTINDTKEIHMKAASNKDEKDSVTDAVAAATGSLKAEQVVKEKIPIEEEETGDSSLPCVSKYDTCVSKHEDELSNTNQLLSSSISVEFKPPSLANHSESISTKVNDGPVSCSADADLLAEDSAKLMAGDTSEVDANLKQIDENDVSSDPCNEESVANSGEMIDIQENSGSPAKVMSSSKELEPQLSTRISGPITAIDEKKEKHSSAVATPSLSAVRASNIDKKLEFDLNEGFDMDEMKSGELIDFAASSLPTSFVSPGSGCLAGSSERLFFPSEDPLRNRTELGWKGLAATSAFHPAEPRKVLEVSDGSSKAPPHDGITCKQVRPLLEIDLNVADERILQDISIQNSGMKVKHKPDDRINPSGEFTGSRFSHHSGGFELDLNRVDDAAESGQDSAASCLQIHSFSTSAPAIVDASTRDFDLNNGPALDEKTFEPLSLLQPHSNNSPQPHFGLRMNRPMLSSKSSWDSPGTTYSAVTVATPLPDRGDHPFPMMAAVPPQRILSGLTSGMSFNPDFYRGPALSSSPLQYPVFPFGTTFPLPTSLPGGSAAYMDPSYSSAPRFYAPAIPAQFVGSAAAIPSQYLRPSIVSVPDIGGNSVGQSSQNFGRQGLDLNSGPGSSLDIEGRDRTLNMSTRQFGAVNPQGLPGEQARTYQVTGGLSKRKEPDGGWDADGNSYKQPSWR